jgi:acetylornithine deacetylase/succinyl-diaminopimelate desuccinylase-like protein
MSVGRIAGGISVNAIPDEAWLEIDVRSTSPKVLAKLDVQVRRIIATAAEEENGRRLAGTALLSSNVEIIGERPCGETPPDHPLVQSAVEATRLVGRQPDLATASTDANVPISLGIPAIAIGAGGRGGEAHTSGEWFDNTDGSLGIARALTIVAGAAELEA